MNDLVVDMATASNAVVLVTNVGLLIMNLLILQTLITLGLTSEKSTTSSGKGLLQKLNPIRKAQAEPLLPVHVAGDKQMADREALRMEATRIERNAELDNALEYT